MVTTVLVVLGIGSLVGGALGWKLGRAYERLRGAPASKKPAGPRQKDGR